MASQNKLAEAEGQYSILKAAASQKDNATIVLAAHNQALQNQVDQMQRRLTNLTSEKAVLQNQLSSVQKVNKAKQTNFKIKN